MTATFSEAVQGGQRHPTFTLKPGTAAHADVAAAVTYNATTRVATLNPSANLAANTQYTATLTGGASGYPGRGRQPAGDRLLDLHHRGRPGDTTAPTVTSRTPSSNATGVSRTANITATFSEAVNGVYRHHGHPEDGTAPAEPRSRRTVTRNGDHESSTLNPDSTLASNDPVHRHPHRRHERDQGRRGQRSGPSPGPSDRHLRDADGARLDARGRPVASAVTVIGV